MKITKIGIDPNKIKWTGTCRTCGTVATATQPELTRVTIDENEKLFSWEVCPHCNAGDSQEGYRGILFEQPEPNTVCRAQDACENCRIHQRISDERLNKCIDEKAKADHLQLEVFRLKNVFGQIAVMRRTR